MELNHNNRILFDPVSHSYLLDGEKLLIGVTSLLKKHNLSADYSGISEATLKKAAEEGTVIHREIQNYEEGKAIFASELIDEYKKLGLRFIEAEYLVSDYETCASAIDCVYEGAKPNGVILVDIKSTQKYHRRPLEAQLGIYKVLFERMNPDKVVEACYCLWIDKKARKIKGFLPVDPMTEEEVNALLECERKGETYVDTNALQDASLAIPEEELAGLVTNAKTIADLKAQIKFIEDKIAEHYGKLLSYMEANNLDEMAAPGGVFKRKKGSVQVRVDSAKLKEKYPSVFTACAKEVPVKGSVSFKPKE